MSQEVPLVVLDRAGEQTREYEVVARTSCVRCGATVLLGAATVREIQRGARGLCLPCAHELDGAGVLPVERRIGRVVDPPTPRINRYSE